MLQVVVYAGAIMVLFLFVLMLLNVQPRGARRRARAGAPSWWRSAWARCWRRRSASVLAAARRVPASAAGFDASTRSVARVLFSPQYLYVFEATSVLILAALVGAVVLARRRTP